MMIQDFIRKGNEGSRHRAPRLVIGIPQRRHRAVERRAGARGRVLAGGQGGAFDDEPGGSRDRRRPAVTEPVGT